MNDYIKIYVTYKYASKMFPAQTKTIRKKIRSGKSKYKKDAFSTFLWYIRYPDWGIHTQFAMDNCSVLVAKKGCVAWQDNKAL